MPCRNGQDDVQCNVRKGPGQAPRPPGSSVQPWTFEKAGVAPVVDDQSNFQTPRHGVYLEHLEHIALDHVRRHAPSSVVAVHVLLEVVLEVLEDEVKLVLAVNDIHQLDNIGVLELLEQGDLANGSRGNALILGIKPDLLQGDDGLRLLVAGLVHDTVCALANLFNLKILVHGF